MMFYEDHNPPHIHVEYSGRKALFDFNGNIIRGNLESKTATRLVREWIDLHQIELTEDWENAKSGNKLRTIEPLR